MLEFRILNPVSGGATREQAIKFAGSYTIEFVVKNNCNNGYTAYAFADSARYRTPQENVERLRRAREKMAKRDRKRRR